MDTIIQFAGLTVTIMGSGVTFVRSGDAPERIVHYYEDDAITAIDAIRAGMRVLVGALAAPNAKPLDEAMAALNHAAAEAAAGRIETRRAAA